MIDLIESTVRKMMDQVSEKEQASNLRLRHKADVLLREIGEMRNDLTDEAQKKALSKRGTHETKYRREAK